MQNICSSPLSTPYLGHKVLFYVIQLLKHRLAILVYAVALGLAVTGSERCNPYWNIQFPHVSSTYLHEVEQITKELMYLQYINIYFKCCLFNSLLSNVFRKWLWREQHSLQLGVMTSIQYSIFNPYTIILAISLDPFILERVQKIKCFSILIRHIISKGKFTNCMLLM
jgi:hypothetical protein